MTHSAGLACNDYDDASPGNENTMQTQREQPDWWKYTLDLPMAHDPGNALRLLLREHQPDRRRCSRARRDLAPGAVRETVADRSSSAPGTGT